MRVLIVDDDGEFRRDLSALLVDGGHTATEAPSAVRAVEALEHGEFDVMFTDLRMGRQSGMELLTQARERWPRLLVVMLTSKATVETAVQALHLGAFDYLRKPVQPHQVQRVLELVGQQLALIRVGAKPMDAGRFARTSPRRVGTRCCSSRRHRCLGQRKRSATFRSTPRTRSGSGTRSGSSSLRRSAPPWSWPTIEELLARHRAEEVTTLLDQIRMVLQGKGPLAVGYDPDKITATGALAVRSSIMSADASTTLESLDNPIRRLVLLRLVDGPSSFMQAMEAAHLDDTSKIAFHLRKLTESGLVTHLARERYRLAPRGRGATRPSRRSTTSTRSREAGTGSWHQRRRRSEPVRA